MPGSTSTALHTDCQVAPPSAVRRMSRLPRAMPTCVSRNFTCSSPFASSMGRAGRLQVAPPSLLRSRLALKPTATMRCGSPPTRAMSSRKPPLPVGSGVQAAPARGAGDGEHGAAREDGAAGVVGDDVEDGAVVAGGDRRRRVRARSWSLRRRDAVRRPLAGRCRIAGDHDREGRRGADGGARRRRLLHDLRRRRRRATSMPPDSARGAAGRAAARAADGQAVARQVGRLDVADRQHGAGRAGDRHAVARPLVRQRRGAFGDRREDSACRRARCARRRAAA